MTDLFTTPETLAPPLEMFPELPRNRTKLEAWKERHGIRTFHAPHLSDEEGRWLACMFARCLVVFKNYELTEEEKTSLPALYAGYCRLIDEWGLDATSNTEEDACFKLAERYKMPWLESIRQADLEMEIQQAEAEVLRLEREELV